MDKNYDEEKPRIIEVEDLDPSLYTLDIINVLDELEND